MIDFEFNSAKIKEDNNDLEDVKIPVSVDKKTFQEVEKLLVDTYTGYMENFHTVAYASNPVDPYNTWLY